MLQQYDLPSRVFEHPVNMFVASFVGSPAMSLVPLRAITRGAEVSLQNREGWDLPLSPGQCAQSAVRQLGQDCAWRATQHRQAAQAAVAGRRAGQSLYRRADRRRHLRTGLSGRCDRRGQPEPSVVILPDEPVWIEFDQNKMHLFDGETSMALKAA